jgi:hypothetical protein
VWVFAVDQIPQFSGAPSKLGPYLLVIGRISSPNVRIEGEVLQTNDPLGRHLA